MNHSVDLRTLSALLIWTGTSAAGNLLLSRGMRQMPPFVGFHAAELLRFLHYVATTPAVVGGTALLAIGFASFLALLSWAPLSVVVPAGAGSYVFVTLLARWVLGEPVPGLRWLGVAMVTLGVALVLASNGPVAPASPPDDHRPDAPPPSADRPPKLVPAKGIRAPGRPPAWRRIEPGSGR